MNRKEYLAKRAKLLEEAQNLINEGKITDYEAKEKEIKDLDSVYEAQAKAQANMNALKDQVPADPVIQNITGQGAGAGESAAAGVIDSTRQNPRNEKQEYLAAWGKMMMGKALNEAESAIMNKFNPVDATQTAGTHAVVIPETVAAGIWKEAEGLYPILKDAKMTFVPGDLTIKKETAAGTDAEWYDEETEVGDSDVAVGELTLTGCELAKCITVSWKLKKMAMDAFIAYITTKLAEKMGAALAKGIVSGKGKPGEGDTFKPQARGIITAIEAESQTPQIVTYTTEPDYDDLTAAMAKISAAYVNGSSIYAKSTTIWNRLAGIKDLDGRPLFIPDVTAGGVGRMFGLPVKPDDSIPTDGILFGNAAQGYVLNCNENMTLYTEDHMKARNTDYMGYAIVDGDVLTTRAFAYLKKSGS